MHNQIISKMFFISKLIMKVVWYIYGTMEVFKVYASYKST